VIEIDGSHVAAFTGKRIVAERTGHSHVVGVR
jgi:hypothetical protein